MFHFRRPPSGCFAALLLLALVGPGCGDENGGTAIDPSPVAGTAAFLDLDADLSKPAAFYRQPYPNDLRLDSDGRAHHGGFPGGSSRLLRSVLDQVDRRRLWPLTPFAYFQFDAALAERRIDAILDARPNAPVLLINIDTGSPDYARLYPTVASTPPADLFVPDNLLAVAAPAGVVLAPRSKYAFVVRRSLGDAQGAPLGVPESLARLRAGLIPRGSQGERAAAVYRPLWPALRRAGIDPADVAAATVFSTGDPVAELASLSDRLRQRHAVSIENLHVDPDDGAAHERFCELRGTATLPLLQRGTPPYDRDGLFEYAVDGLPVVQGEQAIPVSLTLPRLPMPEGGFPLVMYFHGTNGLADQVVDRGPVREPGGERAKGQGPAHVLAAHGFATFGAALPLNPERYTGPVGISGRSYLNLSNLGAYPDTFRQMAIEQRLLLDALAGLEIDPEVVAECQLDAPRRRQGFILQTAPMYLMGQSLGAQIVNMVGAIEPRVAAVVPTGSGGYWSLTVLTADFAPGLPPAAVIASLLGVPEVRDHLHPGLQIVQSAFEAAEPLVYAARLARRPLPGHSPRSIYQPIAIDDPGFPNVIYNAMALASGTQQAGDILDGELQRALAWDGLGGHLTYAVRGNGRSLDGRPYTGVVVQYRSDGILDGHHIFSQLDAVKSQYGCFLRSLLDDSVGLVSAPAPLAAGCSSPVP
jgi:hypothetical protein